MPPNPIRKWLFDPASSFSLHCFTESHPASDVLKVHSINKNVVSFSNLLKYTLHRACWLHVAIQTIQRCSLVESLFFNWKNPHRMEKKQTMYFAIFLCHWAPFVISYICWWTCLHNKHGIQCHRSLTTFYDSWSQDKGNRYLFKRHISDKDLLKNTTGICSSAYV